MMNCFDDIFRIVRENMSIFKQTNVFKKLKGFLNNNENKNYIEVF